MHLPIDFADPPRRDDEASARELEMYLAWLVVEIRCVRNALSKRTVVEAAPLALSVESDADE